MIFKSGMIRIQGQDPIVQDLSLERFLKSSFSRVVTGRANNNNELAFYLKIRSEDRDFIFVFAFRNSVLKEIYIYNISDGLGSLTEERSLLTEQKRKENHDLILKEYLGEGPYSYSWGSVTSTQGGQDGGSKIIVRYN